MRGWHSEMVPAHCTHAGGAVQGSGRNRFTVGPALLGACPSLYIIQTVCTFQTLKLGLSVLLVRPGSIVQQCRGAIFQTNAHSTVSVVSQLL